MWKRLLDKKLFLCIQNNLLFRQFKYLDSACNFLFSDNAIQAFEQPYLACLFRWPHIKSIFPFDRRLGNTMNIITIFSNVSFKLHLSVLKITMKVCRCRINRKYIWRHKTRRGQSPDVPCPFFLSELDRSTSIHYLWNSTNWGRPIASYTLRFIYVSCTCDVLHLIYVSCAL